MLARLWRNWFTPTSLVSMQNSASSRENSLAILIQLNMHILHKAEVTLLDNSPRGVKTYAHVCICMYVIVLFVTA